MIFLDTSALAKRYVREAGSDEIVRLMETDLDWSASALALTEASITLCRADEGRPPAGQLQRRLHLDWDRIFVVPVDSECLWVAADIGCEYRIRTLDAIHLAAALRVPGPPTFLTFDHRQAAVASQLGFPAPSPDGLTGD